MALGDELRVADVIRRQGAERGDVIAIRHGSRALTYRALDKRSNRLAQALLAAGVGPGSRVGHLDRTGPEVIELLFAASKIGAVLVPLNWRLAVPELTRIVADAAAPLLIAGSAFADAASAIAGALPSPLRTVEVGPAYERWVAAHDPVDPGDRGASGDTVVQLYTSGATGVPKGVLTHTATSRPPPRRRRAGASTPTRSASRRCRCSTSAASAGRSSACGTARARSWSASSRPKPCSTCSRASA